MKIRLPYLAALLLLLPAFAVPHKAQAQQIVLECIVSTMTPCNSASDVGNGTQGVPIWQAGGYINTMNHQVYHMWGDSSNWESTGVLLPVDVANFFGCGDNVTLFLNGAGGCTAPPGGGSSASINVSLFTCTSSGPLTGSGTIALTGCLWPVSMGGIGATNFGAAGLVQFTATNPVDGHCPQWSGTTGLQVDSGAPCAGTSSGSRTQWVSETANTTLSVSNTSVLADATSGNLTMTLPAGASDTHSYCVTKKDATAHTVSVTTTGGATIQFVAAPAIISFQGNGICLNSDSSGNWVF